MGKLSIEAQVAGARLRVEWEGNNEQEILELVSRFLAIGGAPPGEPGQPTVDDIKLGDEPRCRRLLCGHPISDHPADRRTACRVCADARTCHSYVPASGATVVA